MLSIKNIDKIIGVDGHLVKVSSTHTPNIKHPHPQRTYDMVFEHRDRPGREFFLTIDREGGNKNMSDETDYPVCFWELTGPHNQSLDVSVWEQNLMTPTLFLNFIDNLIHHYTSK